MNRHGRDVKFATQRALVQRLPSGIDLVFGQRIKHERVIGIRGMPKK